MVLTFFAADLLHIEPELQKDFRILMSIQCAVLAAGFPMRIFYHLLTAHQRTDISNYSQIGLFLVNYTVLWLCFAHGRGVFSLAYANMASALFLAFSSLACLLVFEALSFVPCVGASELV